MKRKIAAQAAAVFALAALAAGCSSTKDMENEILIDSEGGKISYAKNRRQEAALNQIESDEWEAQERLKEQDIESTVVYVEKPVYVPEQEAPDAPKKGKDAVKASTEGSIKEPEKFKNGAMWYDYDETFTYEIFCQAYRVTDLVLEPGEQVLEMPFLSENQVWEIGAGVSRQGMTDVQHFFLKPSMSGLTTSMIIITDKRIYHLLLKSFKDAYMSIVRWNYPNSMPFKVSSAYVGNFSLTGQAQKDETAFNPKYLSFDYKMKYSLFHKPVWLPTLVFDDGRKTYIRMNETVLHRESPALFNNKNELINYRVDGNLIIIDQLIDKVTLKRTREKVIITKKNYKPSAADEEIPEKKDQAVKFNGVTITSQQAEAARKSALPKKETPDITVEYKMPPAQPEAKAAN